MSLQAAVAVMKVRDPALTVGERYVLLVYAVHAGAPDGQHPLEAWPTAPTVAAETGLTREHVQRCLKVLQDRGLMVQTGQRRGRANVYRVDLSRITALGAVCARITPTSDGGSHLGVMEDHIERKGERKGESTTKDSPPMGAMDVPLLALVPAQNDAPTEAPVRDDVERLCSHLAARIVANGSKPPRITKTWRQAARLLMDADGRTEDQVMRAIDWCQADPFWKSNVLSMPTLRAKYDTLRLRASTQGSSGKSTARQREDTTMAAWGGVQTPDEAMDLFMQGTK